MSKQVTKIITDALDLFNAENGKQWQLGTSWIDVNKDYQKFINNFLFPKLNESEVIVKPLGNRFNFLAKEVNFIGQYSEEYVILDSLPVNMDLSQDRTLLLKQQYPKIATKIYGAGILRKMKFTLNNNLQRFNFATLKDGINYALAVYSKKISDINVIEESEIKAMLCDYAFNHTKDKRRVLTIDDILSETTNALLNIQNNSSRYNECSSIVEIPYTTQTSLDDVIIITNDKIKAKLLDTKLANTFNAEGIDFSNKIMSFDNFKNIYKVKENITVNAELLKYLQGLSDYQVKLNDVIVKDSIFIVNDYELEKVNASFEHIKIKEDFAFIIDKNKIKYRRYTRDMLKSFDNPEFNETNHWLHWYSFKAISPFYNNVLIYKE